MPTRLGTVADAVDAFGNQTAGCYRKRTGQIACWGNLTALGLGSYSATAPVEIANTYW
jgi:hypothetical protein